LPTTAFTYKLARHEDARGVFVEMLRTANSGQISFFTAHPGATRGGHYHHTKTEKFLVVQGTARFGFRNIESGETHVRLVRESDAEVVQTVPGWAHDITNVGANDLVVMLWANEVFDPARPDTVAMKVKSELNATG
jgi:UDP-2-acetamido-2,6-beta-L-arabino-hexul-4-ose reductase